MGLLGNIKRTINGARKIEIFILIALLSAALLIVMSDRPENNSAASFETRMENILGKIEGIGRVKVMINDTTEDGITGILVVAEGTDNLNTYLELQKAVHTLTGVDVSCIEIIEMGE